MPRGRKPKPKIEQGAFHVVLMTGDIKYETYANSIAEGIRQLDPKVFKVKGVLKAEHDGKKAELFFRPILMRRLGVNRDMQVITEKRLMMLMR